MELCKVHKTMCVNESKECVQESIDLDFQENLPQYLDDVERVIRCTSKGVVTNCEIGEGKITLHGKVMICLTYQNSVGALLSNIFEEEFSKNISISSQSVIDSADVKLINKYCNFRLINQRRIDIHIALGACITVLCCNNSSYLAECDNAFVRNYSPEYLNNIISGVTLAEFDETFTIPNANSQIKNIVNAFSVCYVDDKKIIKDKMLVKLKLELSVVYCDDCDNIDKCINSFSISKIVDVGGCDEASNAFINVNVSNLYIKSKTNASNALCDIEAVGNIAISYKVFDSCNIDIVTDSYMLTHKTELKRERVLLKANPQYYYDDRSEELIFDCDKNVVEIIDLKTDIVNTEIINSVLNVTVLLSYLYYDEEAQLCYFEKTQKVTYKLNDDELDGEGNANLLTYDFVLKGTDKIALRISYVYYAYLYKQRYVDYVTDIEVTDKKDTASVPQLTLYFADVNENLWDIAKKFSTDMSLIMAENNLTSNIIKNKMVLLVPGM